MTSPVLDIPGLIRQAVEEVKMERFNLLVVGASGVGKSTLVNVFFGADVAKAGSGKPVTQHITEYQCKDKPLNIVDTKGLEMQNYQGTLDDLRAEIESRAGTDDATRHIHIAWLCLDEDSRRVQQAHEDVLKMLTGKGIPCLAVITKSRQDRDPQSGIKFSAQVAQALSGCREVVRVRALAETFDQDDEDSGAGGLKPMGLDKLLKATCRHVSDGVQAAVMAAQQVNWAAKEEAADRVVNWASAAAAAAAANPIPFADAAVIAPIQIAMMVKINNIYGLELGENSLTTLLGTMAGVGGATLVGRTLVTGLLKMVPGIGTVAGGVISAGTAGAVTKGMGSLYIKAVSSIFEDSKMGHGVRTVSVEDLNDRLKRLAGSKGK